MLTSVFLYLSGERCEITQPQEAWQNAVTGVALPYPYLTTNAAQCLTVPYSGTYDATDPLFAKVPAENKVSLMA